MRYSARQHGFIALQGLFLFSGNYLVFYWATDLLTSGIVALLFSTVILMNIMNGAIFMGNAIRPRVVLGSCFGITGIVAIFWSEVGVVENTADTWRGLWMCLIATYFASVGNILSARNQKSGIPVVQTNAWGMAYGALAMMVFAVIGGASFNYDPTFSYGVSLSLPCSIRFDSRVRILPDPGRTYRRRQGGLCRGSISGNRARSVYPV